MKVFISHAFEDAPQFDNLTWAFKSAGIEFWDPREVRAGTQLADQLRQAILGSSLCVFLATARSVKSAWCAAELGAFWGAGKKVLVYLADAALEESALPKQLQGHFYEQRLPNLLDHIKRDLQPTDDAENSRAANLPTSPRSDDDLRELLDATFSRALTLFQHRDAFTRLSDELSLLLDKDPSFSARRLLSPLSRLLNRRPWELEAVAAESFPYMFVLETTTGSWHGYAQRQTAHGPEHAPDVVVQTGCILLKNSDEDRWTRSAAVVEKVVEGRNRGVAPTSASEQLVAVGDDELGVAKADQHH